MAHPLIKEELEKRLDQLPIELQRRVLDFAQALVQSTPKGVPGKSLLQFAGIMSAEDAASMEQAIDEGCEKVDEDEW